MPKLSSIRALAELQHEEMEAIAFNLTTKKVGEAFTKLVMAVDSLIRSSKAGPSGARAVSDQALLRILEFRSRWESIHKGAVKSLQALASEHVANILGGASTVKHDLVVPLERFSVHSFKVSAEMHRRFSLSAIAGSVGDVPVKPSNKIRDLRWMANRVSRTETSFAYNNAVSEETIDRSVDDPDILNRWTEHVSDVTGLPLDKRVGLDSIWLHGQLRRPGVAFRDVVLGRSPLTPPNRPHDRAILVPVRRSWVS